MPVRKAMITMTSAKEDVEKAPLCTAGGMYIGFSHNGKWYGTSPKEIKGKTLIWPRNSTCGY